MTSGERTEPHWVAVERNPTAAGLCCADTWSEALGFVKDFGKPRVGKEKMVNGYIREHCMLVYILVYSKYIQKYRGQFLPCTLLSLRNLSISLLRASFFFGMTSHWNPFFICHPPPFVLLFMPLVTF